MRQLRHMFSAGHADRGGANISVMVSPGVESVSTTAASTGPRAGPRFLITIGLATQYNFCRVPTQHPPVHKVVNGYPVTVNRGPIAQQLCAADADGLFVTIQEFGNHPTMDVLSLFAHHLQLLGTGPAHWATQPIR
jgi:hypothetical protein